MPRQLDQWVWVKKNSKTSKEKMQLFSLEHSFGKFNAKLFRPQKYAKSAAIWPGIAILLQPAEDNCATAWQFFA